MTKTVLITGSSSGIGKATAELFCENGWNVIATMRNTDDANEFSSKPNILVARLDVTDGETIKQAVTDGIRRFGTIDVLVNNAGYGAYGMLEAFSMERIRRQFDTNVIGLLETTKAVLPHFRANKSGTIVNISSIGGKMTFPLGTLYHGTKFAVEGLSEALHFEMQTIGVSVKIIEPGMISTDFGGRSFDAALDPSEMPEYEPVVQALMKTWGVPGRPSSNPRVVAEVIFEAATDGTNKLRYTAGDDARELMANRKSLDEDTFIAGIKAEFGLG